MRIYSKIKAIKIYEPQSDSTEKSVVHLGHHYIALLKGQFGKGTEGLVEVDHLDAEIAADIAASIRAVVVHEEELDGMLAELYRQFKPKLRVGTARDFLNLFTEEEQDAFFTATLGSAKLMRWWAKASSGEFSLDHGGVKTGLADLVKAGLLTKERAAEINAADFDDDGE